MWSDQHRSQALVPFGEGDECLRLDCAAPLEKGCVVALIWGGRLAQVGWLVREPVPHRRFVIKVSDEKGRVRCSKMFGPKDKNVTICRVIGRGRVTPI
jgi:hypothetical protein